MDDSAEGLTAGTTADVDADAIGAGDGADDLDIVAADDVESRGAEGGEVAAATVDGLERPETTRLDGNAGAKRSTCPLAQSATVCTHLDAINVEAAITSWLGCQPDHAHRDAQVAGVFAARMTSSCAASASNVLE